jgi:hypothetical protein
VTFWRDFSYTRRCDHRKLSYRPLGVQKATRTSTSEIDASKAGILTLFSGPEIGAPKAGRKILNIPTLPSTPDRDQPLLCTHRPISDQQPHSSTYGTYKATSEDDGDCFKDGQGAPKTTILAVDRWLEGEGGGQGHSFVCVECVFGCSDRSPLKRGSADFRKMGVGQNRELENFVTRCQHPGIGEFANLAVFGHFGVLATPKQTRVLTTPTHS